MAGLVPAIHVLLSWMCEKDVDARDKPGHDVEAKRVGRLSKTSSMAKRKQVIIVGGGPTGLALAVTLGLRSIGCVLVEARPAAHRIPKGQYLTHRSAEHFYFWGIVDKLRAARVMPPGYPIGEITAYDNLMHEFWYAQKSRDVVRDYYFQGNERLPQYQTEAVLRDYATTLPNVEVRFGWAAKAVEQDENGVRVTVAREGGNEEELLEADYVAGCDGPRSVVREQIGIQRDVKEYDQLMVLAVLRSRELHEGLKRFPEGAMFRVMHPDAKGYWKFFGRVDVGEGFFFHAPVPPNTTRDNFDFLGLLQETAGFKFSCEFEHLGFWEMRVAVADRYQVGRAFIAGDAAHSHPPYGGFGLNSSLEDAVNLGWKLAARLQGWGGDALLRSYSEERRPIFHEIAEDFIAKRITNDSEFYTRYNPNRDRVEFEQVWNARQTDIADRAQVYEPGYEGSPVVVGPPGGKTTAHGQHTFKARSGHHLPPQPLSSGRNVFEELGRGFTLLAFGVDDTATHGFERAAQALNIPFKVVRDSYADDRTKYETRMILVRPDQFVAWTGDKAPADADAIVRKVAGRG
jgi:2-polyprenyl-6-methoxyphenol hydroxylase-like FAD-dependent oxidoreductase